MSAIADPIPVFHNWPYVREMADRISQAKRLTDAELAAEWQQSQRHMAVAVICAKPNANHEIRRTETLHRFATLPHYDEADR